MFNDSVCFTLVAWCIYELMRAKWLRATIAYTLALSIKLSPIYFAPGFAIIIWRYNGLKNSIRLGFIAIGLFVLLSLPFLLVDSKAYLEGCMALAH